MELTIKAWSFACYCLGRLFKRRKSDIIQTLASWVRPDCTKDRGSICTSRLKKLEMVQGLCLRLNVEHNRQYELKWYWSIL